ncbi:MAG: ABC transporter ATP-binding protein [Solirubrobacteraceae bacterium]
MVNGASAALKAERLTHRFGERTALADVSFEVGAGELVAVIGPNGAGKTTLLSVLAGVLTPADGSVWRAGGIKSRQTGWVPQRPALYSKLSVAENLRLFARLEGVDDPDAAVALMLEQTGLRDRADDQVRDLSGGNQQRVNIAIGLLSDPQVLLLDEPSSTLDPRQRARLWEFIAGLAGGGTSVVYSTHDVLEAQHHADRVLALDEGRLVFVGSPAAMDWTY